MGDDMTVRLGDGMINLRVGAIITKDDRVLMVRNPVEDWYYSVGGRIQFGETAEQAVVREVREELGVELEIDRLGFITENYFYGTMGDNTGRLIYELCFYFYMRAPEAFRPNYDSITVNEHTEYIEWVPFDTPKTVYPAFFKTELSKPWKELRHFVVDER